MNRASTTSSFTLTVWVGFTGRAFFADLLDGDLDTFLGLDVLEQDPSARSTHWRDATNEKRPPPEPQSLSDLETVHRRGPSLPHADALASAE